MADRHVDLSLPGNRTVTLYVDANRANRYLAADLVALRSAGGRVSVQGWSISVSTAAGLDWTTFDQSFEYELYPDNTTDPAHDD